MRPAGLLVALAALLAGCAAPAPHAHETATSVDLPPGAEGTLRFDHAGAYVLHCHPHPWMEHRVEVQEGAPAEAHVHATEGESPETYRFEPASSAVAPGGAVTFHNHGREAHTATMEA